MRSSSLPGLHEILSIEKERKQEEWKEGKGEEEQRKESMFM